MTCRWYEVCPLRQFEQEGKLSLIWADNFCKTIDNWKNCKNCKRYQLEEAGIPHPDNMLPSGEADERLV